jgi:choline dehydrogenase
VGANLADHPAPDVDLGFRGDYRAAPVVHSLATFHSSSAGRDDPPDLALWVSEPFGDPKAAYVDAVLLKPVSRGSVRLRSADPGQPPRIDLPGLRDEHDVDRLCEAFARALDSARSPEPRRVCSDPFSPDPRNAEDIRAAVLRGTASVPHTVGTCAMGPSPDDGAVVNTEGRVHGVSRLSVIDASIIPTAPSGFPQIIAIMMAQRLAGILA